MIQPIDGEIVGDVYAHTLIIDSSSKTAVKGDVKSFNLLLDGTIEGEIYTLESLELFPQAITAGGDVYFQHLNMEAGAQVNGRLIKASETDNSDFSLTEQSLNQCLELEEIHAVDTATHYFSAECVIDSPVKMQFMGSGNASLIIKSGGSIIGDITSYALYIEQDATVTGAIQCNRVHSDGSVFGDIYAHTLVVGSPDDTDQSTVPRIEGQVKCYMLRLNGEIKGDVHIVEQTLLLEQAKIRGDLYYNGLEMKHGAEIGYLLMIDDTDEHTALRRELDENIPETIENTKPQTSAGLSLLWAIVIVLIITSILF